MSSYIDHVHAAGRNGIVCTHSWAVHTGRNLAWHYGPARAVAIVAGNDPATMADLARWNGLGRRCAA